ncbi:MAG TPA: hypothetical protein VG937_06170 [Polyangiaceae bacterium]|nr:hypothetical protein [Polyangiaceae bacterium]
MLQRSLIPSLLACASLGILGCGAPDESDEVGRVGSALHAVQPWIMSSTGLFQDAPALARLFGGPTMAVGWGLDSKIYVTQQDGNSNWSAYWSVLGGEQFSTRPAAVGIRLSVGPLSKRVAIVARGFDNQYYITIRDASGSIVVQNWAAIPNGGTWASAPAITHVPPSSPVAPANTLILAGLRADGHIQLYKNTLAGGLYQQSNWVSLATVPDPPGAMFQSAPALAFPCDFTYPLPGTIIAARDTNNKFSWVMWRGTSFLNVVAARRGTFVSDPALATGCGSPSAEVVLYGRQADNHIWYSTQLTGGTPDFTSLPQTFVGNPTAMGFLSNESLNSVMVGAMDPSGFMFTSSALAH